MYYKIYLILFITSWLGCSTAFGDEQRYRVELLVLRHLDGFSELMPQATLRDFSSALDLLAPPPAEAIADPLLADEAAAESTEPEILPVEEEFRVEEPETQIVLVETQGEQMQLAWQRLRGSSAFRPELYLSWEQAGEEPFPLIRLHDQQVLIEDDPYADLRQEPDPGSSDDAVAVSSSGATVALPAPTRFYRLDGTARLTRSRFLHLDIDIEYREPLPGEGAQQSQAVAAGLMDEDKPQAAAFLVHRLQQKRQMLIQEMQYFDGPVIGVLALISRTDTIADQDTAVDPIAE